MELRIEIILQYVPTNWDKLWRKILPLVPFERFHPGAMKLLLTLKYILFYYRVNPLDQSTTFVCVIFNLFLLLFYFEIIYYYLKID